MGRTWFWCWIWDAKFLEVKLTRTGRAMVPSSEAEDMKEDAACEDGGRFRLGQVGFGVQGGAI